MIFWRYTALFFSAIALLSLQKMSCLAPKSLSQNAELILCPFLRQATNHNEGLNEIPTISFFDLGSDCFYLLQENG